MSHLECACSVTQSCLTLATPYSVARQAPLSLGFSRQEYWSGLAYSSPGDLPDRGIEPRFPGLQEDSLPSEPPGKPNIKHSINQICLKRVCNQRKSEEVVVGELPLEKGCLATTYRRHLLGGTPRTRKRSSSSSGCLPAATCATTMPCAKRRMS